MVYGNQGNPGGDAVAIRRIASLLRGPGVVGESDGEQSDGACTTNGVPIGIAPISGPHLPVSHLTVLAIDLVISSPTISAPVSGHVFGLFHGLRISVPVSDSTNDFRFKDSLFGDSDSRFRTLRHQTLTEVSDLISTISAISQLLRNSEPLFAYYPAIFRKMRAITSLSSVNSHKL